MMDGYVLFQLPGEKYCQLRAFTLTETYAGHGTYTRGDVTMQFARVQQCR